jgi:hypothetical protein
MRWVRTMLTAMDGITAEEAVEPISIRKLDRLEATSPPVLGVKLN